MDRDSRGPSDGTLFSSRRNRRSSARPPIWGLLLLAVIGLGALAGWLWFRSREGPEPAPPVTSDPNHVDPSMPPGLGIDDEPFTLPPLGASDAAVRNLLLRLSAHPQLAAWLVTDDLIRRFVEAVVDVSRGSSPVPALEMLIPGEPFSVQRTGGRLLMSPESQRRYDLLGEAVASVDTERAVRAYERLLPLFEEAYRELALADGSFEEVLARAVDNLLAVHVPSGPFEVREAVDRYVFTDERIESLTPAQKHLYRLGPGNAGRVQSKLREISRELRLGEDAGGSR
jgi:hypothetical protein